MDELLDGDGGDEGCGDELVARLGLLDANAFDVEALGLQGAEQLLDRPAAAVQVGDREGLGRIRDRERGERAASARPRPAGGSTSRTSTRLRTTLFGRPVRTPVRWPRERRRP